jgi:N-methylhydantoinase A
LPTVTDADAVLGVLRPHGFAGGRSRLDLDAARRAITQHIAEPLGINVEAAAWGIARVVNANMVNATRRLLASYGADVRKLDLVAFGGNGAVHAWALAEGLGARRVLIPRAAPAFSALGLLVADYLVDTTRSYVVLVPQANVDTLREIETALLAQARSELASTGSDPSALDEQVFVQMSYPGQNFDLSVARGDVALSELAERFHLQHEAERGFAFRAQAPLIRGVRVVVRRRTPKPEQLAEKVSADASRDTVATRPVFFGPGALETAVYQGSSLGAGSVTVGPALIEEPFTTVVVPRGYRAELSESDTFVLSRA